MVCYYVFRLFIFFFFRPNSPNLYFCRFNHIEVGFFVSKFHSPFVLEVFRSVLRSHSNHRCAEAHFVSLLRTFRRIFRTNERASGFTIPMMMHKYNFFCSKFEKNYSINFLLLFPIIPFFVSSSRAHPMHGIHQFFWLKLCVCAMFYQVNKLWKKAITTRSSRRIGK